jgi:hypothetical protein
MIKGFFYTVMAGACLYLSHHVHWLGYDSAAYKLLHRGDRYANLGHECLVDVKQRWGIR